MKTITKYSVVFIVGVIVGYALFGSQFGLAPATDRRSFGVSDDYVAERFAPVCDALKASGCTCEPVVFTERTCQSQLRDVLNDRLFERAERD